MMKKNVERQTTIREKGQVLIIVALTIMMLLAIIGLAIDTGYVYVSYSRLRRAVDAAALAATGEFKRNYTIPAMTASATQQLKLNDIVTASNASNPDASVTIQTCDSTPGDSTLCVTPAQKLVRVKVTQDVPTFFMAVWGFYRVPITIETIAEAASIDLVLLIQNSETMTFDASLNTNRDPSVCNPNGCHPFQEVKTAALDFVNNLMFFPYDRVSVITFNKDATLVLPLSDQSGGDTITPALNGLQVYDPGTCLYTLEQLTPGFFPNPVPAPLPPYNGVDPQRPCRLYNNAGAYDFNFNCPMSHATDISGARTSANNPAWCGTTNPAAGLAMAGNHLQGAYPVGWTGTVRDDAVWVVLLLGTGAPNSAEDNASPPKKLCPMSTRGPDYSYAGCRDRSTITRHCFKSTDSCMTDDPFGVTSTTGLPFTMTASYDPTNYDVYDRSLDMVDTEVQNGIFIFTIGVGKQVKSPASDANDVAPGEAFLQYAAKMGQGLYRNTPNGAGLQAIFLEIANKIATKLTQ